MWSAPRDRIAASSSAAPSSAGQAVGHGRVLVQQRLERCPPARPRQRQGAQRRAVVRRHPGQEVQLRRLAAQLPVEHGQVHRRLVGLGAGGVEETPLEIARGDAPHALGELQHRLVAEREPVGEVEHLGLPLERLDDPRMAVAEQHHHRAAARVQIRGAVLRLDPAAGGADGDRQRLARRSSSSRCACRSRSPAQCSRSAPDGASHQRFAGAPARIAARIRPSTGGESDESYST